MTQSAVSMDINWLELDPGIRDVVALLRRKGFETTDSGDGRTKRASIKAGQALPFPHVFAMTTENEMVDEAEAMACELGDGWVVEATYSTGDRKCILFARKDA